MSGKDMLAILKTSGGKSLCFQLPTIHRGTLTLVISPLISLMKDQVDALTKIGISASYANSSLSPQEVGLRYKALASNQYSLFYVAPERFNDPEFVEAISRSNIEMIAIDEAHCASQWGHSFRPSYAEIGKNLELLEARLKRRLQRVAFTATANSRVQSDIVNILDLSNPDIHIQDFDRPNITYSVQQARSSDRTEEIKQALEEHPDDCTIIYCVTVKEVERIYQALLEKGFPVSRYHGRLEPEEKDQIQEEFISGKIRILVSTSAFGMGVDKSDVRLVIHAQMPDSLEAYSQESGRAGRDGKPSKSILFYHESDKSIHRFFINASNPTSRKIEPIKDRIYTILRYGPEHLDAQRIALICNNHVGLINKVMPGNGLTVEKITRADVMATITLLRNQGELEGLDGVYTIADWKDDADYSWVDEIKKNSWVKFNAMCSWCETRLCRRWQMLRYFDERKPHYRCGTCDNCQREILYKSNNKLLERTVRPSTLMTLAGCIDAISDPESKDKGRWLHVLLGTLSPSLMSPLEVEHAGRFSWNAAGDLKRWREMLEDINVLDADGHITQLGRGWLDGTHKITEFQTSRPEMKAEDIVSHSEQNHRLRILRKWRKSTAYREDCSDISILSEAQLRKLAQTKDISIDGLKKLGYTDKWISKFGKDYNKAIENMNSGFENEL